MKKNSKTLLVILLTLVLGVSLLAGCTPAAPSVKNETAAPLSATSLSSGGTLLIRVNPEFVLTYDENGKVTSLTARNTEAKQILATFTGFENQDVKAVVSRLVTAIGTAGYFVEDLEGSGRKITLEIEPGSSLPTGTFLEDVVDEVKKVVDNHNWTTPIDLEKSTDYGVKDYDETDYGITLPAATEPAATQPTTKPSAGATGHHADHTDYGATDYVHSHANGTCNGNCTDYADTDYGPDNDGVTDYTDYGTAKQATTQQETTTKKATTTKKSTGTDYGNTDYGKTDYGKTDYDKKTDYGKTDYEKKTDYGKTDYR